MRNESFACNLFIQLLHRTALVIPKARILNMNMTAKIQTTMDKVGQELAILCLMVHKTSVNCCAKVRGCTKLLGEAYDTGVIIKHSAFEKCGASANSTVYMLRFICILQVFHT